MRISISAAPVILSLAGFFAGGWFMADTRAAAKLARITEERDLAMQMADASLKMSTRALEHSLSNAGTLEVCLGKLNLTPVTLTPTRRADPRLAQLQP